jgi:hypothetical protein
MFHVMMMKHLRPALWFYPRSWVLVSLWEPRTPCFRPPCLVEVTFEVANVPCLQLCPFPPFPKNPDERGFGPFSINEPLWQLLRFLVGYAQALAALVQVKWLPQLQRASKLPSIPPCTQKSPFASLTPSSCSRRFSSRGAPPSGVRHTASTTVLCCMPPPSATSCAPPPAASPSPSPRQTATRSPSYAP